jgi:hypothetical protein
VIEEYMMRVTLPEIYWGYLFILSGALQIGADKAYMRDDTIPLWTAYILLAAGIFLPSLAWYMRRPFQGTEIDKH